MVRQLSTSSLTPLSLDELDRVAGGLSTNDPNQDPNNQTTQIADGAAFEQARPEPTPEEVQGRFQELVNDYAPEARTHDIDTMSPENVGLLATDIMEGRLDGQLDGVVSMLRGLNPFDGMPWSSDVAQVAQLTAAVLERYADTDRPSSLNGIMLGQERVFTANYIESMGSLTMDSSPKAALELFSAAEQAFDARGRTADADRMEGLFTHYFIDTVVNRHVGEPGLVADMVADGAVSAEQLNKILPVLSYQANNEQLAYVYKEFSEGIGGVEAHLDNSAVKGVYDFMLGRLDAIAGGPQTAEGLADLFAAQSAALDGLHLEAELATIYAARANTLPGGLHDFFQEVMSDAIGSGASAEAIDTLYDWAKQSMTSVWQVVDILFDLPAGNQVEALIGRAFGEALDSEPDPAKIGLLVAEGVVPPGVMIAALVRHYDAASDAPGAFQTLLNAVAAAAGPAAAEFAGLVPRAVFNALIAESADGVLDSAERTLAATLLLADRSLPVGDLPDATLVPVFNSIGMELRKQLTGLSFAAQGPAVASLASVLRGLNDAGPAAIAETIAVLMTGSNGANQANPVTAILNAAESAGMALAIMVAFDTNARVVNNLSLQNRVDGTMAQAVLDGTAIAKLAQSVVGGELTAAEADTVLSKLATQGAAALNFLLKDPTGATASALLSVRDAQLVAAILDAGVSNPALVAELQGQLTGNPPPLLSKLLQVQGQIGGLTGVIGELAAMADAADLDVGKVLLNLYIHAGIDVREVAPAALASLVRDGRLSADEAVAAARSTFYEAEMHDRGVYEEILSPIAGAVGVIRLVAAADGLTGLTVEAAAQLAELRVEFLAQVQQGTFARDVIAIAAAPMWAPQIITMLNEAADTAGVFRGGLFVSVLAALGGAEGGPHSPGYQFRDALRMELYQTLAGGSLDWSVHASAAERAAIVAAALQNQATTQAGWVATLKDALVSREQTPEQVVAALEAVLEHAYANQGRSDDRGFWDANNASARERMVALLDGLDRLYATVGRELLANPATREAALEWFRALPPGGQLEMLRQIPSTNADFATLKGIAAHTLDTFDWGAERRGVDTTIAVGNYNAGNVLWAALKGGQASHDLAAAIKLAAMVDRSPAEQIADMALAWRLIEYNTQYTNAYWTRTYSSDYGVQQGVQVLVTQMLKDATLRNALAVDLAEAVGAGSATVREVYDDIKRMIAIGTDSSNPYDTTWLPNYEKPLKEAFDQALVRLGYTAAAADSFMVQIEDASAFNDIRRAPNEYARNLAVETLMTKAQQAGVAVDLALSAVLDLGFLNSGAADHVRGILVQHLGNGTTHSELLREVGERSMTMSHALELIEDIARNTGRSYGSLVGDMAAAVQAKGSAMVQQFAEALRLDGVNALIQSIGADLQAGRLDSEVVHHYATGSAYDASNNRLTPEMVDRRAAAEAAAAVYAIAQVTGVDRATALAQFVAAASRGDLAAATGQTPASAMHHGAAAAAEAIKLLDNYLAASGNTPQAVQAVSLAMESIRESLAATGQSLVASDMDALNTLADLFLGGAVLRGDIAALIGALDGAVPDRALVALAERMDGAANTAGNAELRAIAAGMLAERVGSGELFHDLMTEIEALSSSDRAGYQAVLDFAERAVIQARFAAFFTEAKLHQSSVSAAAAAADALVELSRPLSEATAAYRLFAAAQAAFDVDAASKGWSFTNWAVNSAADLAVRDQMLAGMFLEIRSEIRADGTLPPDKQAYYNELQDKLMAPEMRQAAALQQAAQTLSPEARELALLQAAGLATQAVSRVADRIAQQALDIANSSAANVVLYGTQTHSTIGREIAEASAQWIVLAGSSYNIPLQIYLTYVAASAADPVMLGVAVACSITAGLMRLEAFRYAIGPGASETIGNVLEAVEKARSILVEGVSAFIANKVDAALGAWDGTKGIYDSFASGKLEDFGPALLKFADNLSSLINIYDMRAQFIALRAGLEQAVKVLREAAVAIAHVVSEGYQDLRNRDLAYQQQHTMGISFL